MEKIKGIELVLIAAYALDAKGRKVIGREGKIPWFEDDEIRRPDMRRFREMTLNQAVIMGRKTFQESLNGKPLKDRINIVLSRNPDFSQTEIIACHSLEEALEITGYYSRPVYVIGGQQLYKQTIALLETRRLEITEIHSKYEGDAFFPDIDLNKWIEVQRENFRKYSFISYNRKGFPVEIVSSQVAE